jgi:hypothetical protein
VEPIVDDITVSVVEPSHCMTWRTRSMRTKVLILWYLRPEPPIGPTQMNVFVGTDGAGLIRSNSSTNGHPHACMQFAKR